MRHICAVLCYTGESPGLRLLLSFAVGGLLGDVFLHLLPEAWSTMRMGTRYPLDRCSDASHRGENVTLLTGSISLAPPLPSLICKTVKPGWFDTADIGMSETSVKVD